MKRIVPLLIVALAVTAFWFKDQWLPPPRGTLNHLGYVEGETILVGAPVAGRIVSMAAVKGGEAAAGMVLFALDPAAARAEVARAEAAVATAEASHANLLSGKRQPEIDIIRAQMEQVEASLDLARKELKRATMLANTGTAAQARLDTAAMQAAVYEARLRELTAQLELAALPARAAEIDAARARIDEAKAAADAARRKLADLAPVAPRDARAEDVFFETGEWVQAGQPVVSLLAPDRITLRFFVPEAAMAAAAPGTKIRFLCDGCGEMQTATITKLAAVPEFTPPVVYSQGARAKLVFKVEARPDRLDERLVPGLPIEVEPLP